MSKAKADKQPSANKVVIIFHLLFLTALTWFIFNRTLGTYFLADDFGEIAYVSRIVGGEYGLIWLNFTGNFMQIPSMSVWRPWLLMSLLFDYLLWGTNPVGYYLTNLLSYNAVVLLFYWFIRQITAAWSSTRSGAAALFASSLFLASPLHCESVSWVVGRVDIVSALFYLLSLNLFLLAKAVFHVKNRYRLYLSLALTSFVLAMWTKEMPIGVPVLLPFLLFFFGKGDGSLKSVIKQCLPIWLATVIYLLLRYLALGTLLGGYVQGIGDAQAAHALSRWLDKDTLIRLFYPLAFGIFGSNHLYQHCLTLLYAVTTGLLLVRLFCLRAPVKMLLFLPVWIVSTLIPIYKLWGLGYELEGARFCFFLTLPLSAALPLILFAPVEKGNRTGDQKNFSMTAYFLLAVSTMTVLTAVLTKICAATNLAWVHTGKEVKEFCLQARALTEKQDEKLLLLGIPKRRGGTHMILNGTTFNILLSPPYTKSKDTQGAGSAGNKGTTKPVRIETFDPIIFGNSEYIDSERFKRLAGDKPTILVWLGELRRFLNVNYAAPLSESLRPLLLPGLNNDCLSGSKSPPGSQEPCTGFLHAMGHAVVRVGKDGLLIDNILEGDGIAFSGLNLNPLSADYLEVKLTVLKPGTRLLKAALPQASPGSNWGPDHKCAGSDDQQKALAAIYAPYEVVACLPENGSPNLAQAGTKQEREQTVLLPLSDNWRWYVGDIDTIVLNLPASGSLKLHSVALKKACQVRPSLRPEHLKSSSTGVYYRDNSDLTLKASFQKDCQALNGMENLVVEITRANTFFENLAPQAVPDSLSRTFTIPVPRLSREAGEAKVSALELPINIKSTDLESGVYQQVRVRAVDRQGHTLGQPSAPVILRLN
ncbi:MAG: hypothetical protein HY986_01035 [Candidatus Melainabacteria bacterium]|nr:hypothetical protein [Candidatus Melainabacteria bacterium]